jgi:hypothetical protein
MALYVFMLKNDLVSVTLKPPKICCKATHMILASLVKSRYPEFYGELEVEKPIVITQTYEVLGKEKYAGKDTIAVMMNDFYATEIISADITIADVSYKTKVEVDELLLLSM